MLAGSDQWVIEIADLNGDGRDDVVTGAGTGNTPQSVQVYLQSGSGTFGPVTGYILPDSGINIPTLEVYAVSAMDLNGDLLPDLAVGSDELFVLFQNPGAPGTFNSPIRLAAQR